MKMEKFVKLMTGHFDNREQFTEMKSAGKLFPYARHVNTVCNDKINNIPENFTGIFIVEEVIMRRMENAMHHRIYFLLRIVTVELCFFLRNSGRRRQKYVFLCFHEERRI